MQKIPISGGPHSGKTTIMNSLRLKYPEAHFIDEPAEQIITAELKKEQEDPNYRGIFPVGRYSEFVRLAIDKSVELEQQIPGGASVIFQDRSHIDNLAYSRLNEHHLYIPEIERRIEAANYAFALICEPVGTYTKTEVRHEDAELAKRMHNYIVRAYEDTGLDIVHLPAVSVDERLELISAVLQ